MQQSLMDWPVRPMEPVSIESAFDNADYLFQLKWDGVRILSYVYPNGEIRLFNRHLNERSAQYPELRQALEGLGRGTVLDGEVVTLDSAGKPDFHRVLRRDLVLSPVKIKALINSIPVHYMVFDVLWLNGEKCCSLPLVKRMEILDGISFKERIHKIESIPEHGKALFNAVKSEGLEGIIAKKADSVYRIGEKTESWQKIKCFRQLKAIVGGYLQQDHQIRSLLVGIPQEEGIRFTGSVASGVKQKQWDLLKDFFSNIPGPCPFINPPTMPDAHWVQPVLKVQVRFLEYSSYGYMRASSIIGFSEDQG